MLLESRENAWFLTCCFVSFSEVSFYTAAPLSLCCNLTPELFRFVADLLAEFTIKGKSHMPAFESDLLGSVDNLLKLRCLQWIGAAIFLQGWTHQRRCHAILVGVTVFIEFLTNYQFLSLQILFNSS